jgi:PAS domain S-box-containing protein
MKKFSLRILLPTILTILLFILTIFLIIIPRFKENIMNGKREMIKELTNSAWSILLRFENDEKTGILTREQAQSAAVSRIQYLRYGEESKDYFWITDMEPKMIMHPFRNDLNGKDLSNFKDPHGKKMFVEFVETVKKSEHGYVDYMWQWKDDSLHIVPKLSYVKIFKPWGWIIGTGIYLEDVNKEIEALTKRLIWITASISLIVALLLFYISQQSLKMELKRREAELKLHESKEKYKALVEAATEGLIMLVDGKISFLNNVITKMTGLEPAELLNQSIGVIISEINSRELLLKFSEKTIPDGQYDVNLKKKSGGDFEALITVSLAVFENETVNILILKDITIDKEESSLTMVDFKKLLLTRNFGFFRVKLGQKGTFLFANETTLQILGFNSFRELSETPFTDLIINAKDVKQLRLQLSNNGFAQNNVIQVQKKDKRLIILSVTLIVVDSDNSGDLTCDGIIEDITSIEKGREEFSNLIVTQKASSFLMEQPIGKFLSEIETMDIDSRIRDAIHLMKTRRTDCILVTRNRNEYIGIITKTDIQHRVLNLNLNLDNPVYLIMSSPIIHMPESSSIAVVLDESEKLKINHVPIVNSAGQFKGLVNIYSILWQLKHSLSFHLSLVKKAQSTADLKTAYQALQKLVKPLILSEITPKYITQITASFSDSVIRRLIEMGIDKLGEPPVDFSFICLGSEGRREETLLTDQDNAIIYEDIAEGREKEVNEYFIKLGTIVCDSLNEIGYTYCKGNIMAMNHQWTQPLSKWKKYFTEWIHTPEPQNLLDASIFFDFRCVYGEHSIVEDLKRDLAILIKNHSTFLYHMAHNTYFSKPPAMPSSAANLEKQEHIDLKSPLSIINMFTRTYCLQHEIWLTNTFDRLQALREFQHISHSTVSEISFAYNFLLKLRLRSQAELSDSGQPLSNLLNLKQCTETEFVMLKKALSIVPFIQNKIGTDFRIKI